MNKEEIAEFVGHLGPHEYKNYRLDFDISSTLGKDVLNLAQDASRALCTSLMVTLMFFLRDGYVSGQPFELFFYTVVGYAFFWMVFRRLVRIR